MITEERTLSVPAIKNGTVIDHIAPGQALRIIPLLHLADNGQLITVGLNLESKSMGRKDLIKIENTFLSSPQTDQIALFSPTATVNVIENYQVVQKFPVAMPHHINGILLCPNLHCITNSEKVPSSFSVEENNGHVFLLCRFCQKTFPRSELRSF